MPKKTNTSSGSPLKEGDFYMNEQGLMVFTEQYLRRRGTCCRNGCRHCPWGHKREGKVKNEKN